MGLNFQEELLQSYSDADLAGRIQASPRLAPPSSIFLLSANLLAKHYQPNLIEDTVRAMELARQLGVRVPHIKRVIEFHGDAYCIMERIEGTTFRRSMGTAELANNYKAGCAASPIRPPFTIGTLVHSRICGNRRMQIFLAG